MAAKLALARLAPLVGAIAAAASPVAAYAEQIGQRLTLECRGERCGPDRDMAHLMWRAPRVSYARHRAARARTFCTPVFIEGAGTVRICAPARRR